MIIRLKCEGTMYLCEKSANTTQRRKRGGVTGGVPASQAAKQTRNDVTAKEDASQNKSPRTRRTASPSPLSGRSSSPPGMPTMPNGSVDICALIPPQTTTSQRTRAGRLALRISTWTAHSLAADGVQYEAQSRDGIVRAFPMPPGQLPRWHGPANLRQPVNSVPMGQARAPRIAARITASMLSVDDE